MRYEALKTYLENRRERARDESPEFLRVNSRLLEKMIDVIEAAKAVSGPYAEQASPTLREVFDRSLRATFRDLEAE